jgi:hypothetical protein
VFLRVEDVKLEGKPQRKSPLPECGNDEACGKKSM